MPTIIDPELSIQVDHAASTAKVSVSCGLEFTEFEVRSMNAFGLRYTLECQLLSLEPYPETVIRFAPQEFPRVRDGATGYEEPAFEATASMTDLHLQASRKGSLVAELHLSNEDQGTISAKRTPVQTVNLPA